MVAVWLAGLPACLLAVVTLVHVLLLVATLRASGQVRRQAAGGGRASGDDSGEGPEGGAVPCPDCGEHNRPVYRFCRRCVTELPGNGVHGGSTGDGVRGGSTGNGVRGGATGVGAGRRTL